MNKTSTNHPKPIRRQITLLIISLFLASAAVRVAGLSAAWATAQSDVEVTETFGSDMCIPNPAFSTMMEDLTARETRLIEAEVAIEQKRVDVELSRRAILEQLVRLEDAEARLEARMAVSSTASEDDLAQLTAVYQAMKPKVAAQLFEAMDPEFAAGFLVRMAPESAAAIVSGMKPAIAYAVSVIVAGRNANALRE